MIKNWNLISQEIFGGIRISTARCLNTYVLQLHTLFFSIFSNHCDFSCVRKRERSRRQYVIKMLLHIRINPCALELALQTLLSCFCQSKALFSFQFHTGFNQKSTNLVNEVVLIYFRTTIINTIKSKIYYAHLNTATQYGFPRSLAPCRKFRNHLKYNFKVHTT